MSTNVLNVDSSYHHTHAVVSQDSTPLQTTGVPFKAIAVGGHVLANRIRNDESARQHMIKYKTSAQFVQTYDGYHTSCARRYLDGHDAALRGHTDVCPSAGCK